MKLYLKFLISKHRLNDDLMEKYGIDQRCIELMELIFVRQAQMATLTVSEIMKINKCGSPATIHRSLIMLRDKDLLVFLHKGTNKRRKYPSLTKQSIEYMDDFSKELLKLQLII